MPDPVTVRPGAPERLARMVQLPTVSAELEQRGLADFERFRDLLAELYPLVHEHLAFEQVTDLGLLYRWNGRGGGDPVVLMAHYDVVPAVEDDGWTFPPFEGRIHDGSVHGRGTLDDKGPLLVLLEAVENLLADGYSPARDVYLSLGGNEESHGAAAAAIADLFRERRLTPWLVLDEGGAVVDAPLPFVKVPAAMVGVGEKGVLTLRLTARGDGGHASAPPARPRPPAWPARCTGCRRTRSRSGCRARCAPCSPPSCRTPAATSRLLLRTLTVFPWVTARVFARLGGEPAALVHTTVAATMLEGGTAANVLPANAVAILNLRIAVGETVASATAACGASSATRPWPSRSSRAPTPRPSRPPTTSSSRPSSPPSARRIPRPTTAPYLMMAATDSRWFHRFSPAVYRFAPLAMTAAQRAAIHGVDEWSRSTASTAASASTGPSSRRCRTEASERLG